MAKKKEINFDELPKDNPFRVPEGYFDGFSERLSEKLQSEKEKNSGKGKIIRIFKNQLALAASLVAFAVISYFSVQFILNRTQSDYQELIFSEYVEGNLGDYEIDLLMDSYSENVGINEVLDDYEQEVIEYLLAENIDLQLLIEEL